MLLGIYPLAKATEEIVYLQNRMKLDWLILLRLQRQATSLQNITHESHNNKLQYIYACFTCLKPSSFEQKGPFFYDHLGRHWCPSSPIRKHLAGSGQDVKTCLVVDTLCLASAFIGFIFKHLCFRCCGTLRSIV